MKSIISLFISLFVLQAVAAQNELSDLYFERLDNTVGLPSNEIRRVYQDSEGFMWFGSKNGLIRYDGYEYVVYRNSIEYPDLLTNNAIMSLAEDDTSLWIGSERGLNKWDRKTRKITKINLPEINNTYINKIIPTDKGYLWLATAKGIFKYFPATNTFESLYIDFPLSTDIKDAYLDSKGRVWFGLWGNGLIRYNEESNSFIQYPKINAENRVHIIFEDRDGNLWVGTWGSGLYKVIGQDNYLTTTYQQYSEDNYSGSINSNIIYAINQDPKFGYIWVGHRNGLSILTNPSNPYSFVNFAVRPSGKLKNNYDVNSIFIDQSGLIWLGMFGYGIDKINLNVTKLKYNSLVSISDRVKNTTITSLYYDDRGLLWMGIKNNGLFVYDTVKDKYYNFCNLVKNRLNITSDVFINDIQYIRRFDEIWVSVKSGNIFRLSLDKTGLPVKSAAISKELMSGHFTPRAFEDNDQNIWILSELGLNVYTRQNKIFRSTDFLSNAANSINCQCYTQDKNGNIWIGTINQGIFRFRIVNDKLSIKHYSQESGLINNQHVISLLSDENNQLWASTQGGGLSLYNPQKDKFESVNARYNIPYDVMFNLLEDSDHNIWMFNENAILKLDIASGGGLQIYDVSGKQWNNSFVTYCLPAKKNKDEYFLGGTSGYTILNFNQMITNTYIPPVVITDFKIDNQSVFSDICNNEIINNKIILKNSENKFNIEFAALSYSNPQRNYYAYRLLGYEKDWHYVNASKRFASYTNIHKGTYKFEVKASNENGIWNDAPINLHITIKPSPFDTWYAWAAYIIAVIGILYLIYSFLIQKIRFKQHVQIVEMQKQNAEELSKTKIRFFTNITHELLTPLTIMECIVDKIKDVSKVDKEQTDILSSNIQRLIYLIRQVLEFRKAESDNLKLKISYGNLTNTIESICESNFKPLMKKKSIHFSVLSNPEIIIGWFDVDKLDKIIHNLLSNAYKYNKPNGFVQVDLKELYIDDKRCIQISVKDNGIGIAPEKLPHIFQRYYDGDYRKQNETGTGIGLSLTKTLVELHNGQISVKSHLGHGSEFIIAFPIDMKNYDPKIVEIEEIVYPITEPETDIINEDMAFSETKRTVLIVDDNQDLLNVLASLLSSEYNVLKASNGRDALSLLSSHNIDLIASDVMMPELNGFELCKYVKSNIETSHIIVLLLTVKSQDEDRKTGYESGADGYMTKPFKPGLLKSRIAGLFNNKDKLLLQFKNQDILTIKELNYTTLDEKFLSKAINIVEEHIDNPDFNFELFVDEIGVTRSTLYRKIKSMTGLTTSDFVKNIRLKKACVILRKGTSNIAEVAYAVGFNDAKYFSKCFKKEFDITPREYVKKNKQSEPLELEHQKQTEFQS